MTVSRCDENLSRGKRKKQNQHEWIPCILELEGSSKEYRKNWARLIQKTYEADPLTCPKCQRRMKIISFIEDEEVIEKILKHLGFWDLKARPPPRTKTPSVTIYLDDWDSQVSFFASPFYPVPEYPMDFSRISKPLGELRWLRFLLSSVSGTLKKPRSEFHIFTWDT